MRFSRYAVLAGLLLGTLLLFGCTKEPKGMPNMIPGTGPPEKKDLKFKKGRREMPPDPPAPKAPP
jgi:hypothetical protein